jgi:DNA polymerase-3 subunit delta'
MLEFTNKSSFNNLARFIFIDNLEYLTINSSNALLKIIEEPNKNTFFILIQDSNKKILNTLKSRCLIFKINLSFDNSILITNKLLKENVLDLINNDLINYYDTPGYLVNLINFSKENNLLLKDYNLNEFLLYLINENFFKKDEFIKKNIFKFIELYFYKKLNNSFDKKNIISFYSKFISKINDTKKFNLDEESLFLEFKSKVLYG